MNKTILLIQVNPAVRIAVRGALQGTEVVLVAEAWNLAEGIYRYETERPNGIVMDMTISPHEMIQGLRRFHKKFPKSRVLVLYSNLSRPNISEARRAGAQEAVFFPFNKENFLDALQRLLRERSTDEYKAIHAT